MNVGSMFSWGPPTLYGSSGWVGFILARQCHWNTNWSVFWSFGSRLGRKAAEVQLRLDIWQLSQWASVSKPPEAQDLDFTPVALLKRVFLLQIWGALVFVTFRLHWPLFPVNTPPMLHAVSTTAGRWKDLASQSESNERTDTPTASVVACRKQRLKQKNVDESEQRDFKNNCSSRSET